MSALDERTNVAATEGDTAARSADVAGRTVALSQVLKSPIAVAMLAPTEKTITVRAAVGTCIIDMSSRRPVPVLGELNRTGDAVLFKLRVGSYLSASHNRGFVVAASKP
jgi:hypothetical protein